MRTVSLISQGSWIVKQSVGKKACLVGQALEINYFHGKNYLEVKYRSNHIYSSWGWAFFNPLLAYLSFFHWSIWNLPMKPQYTSQFHSKKKKKKQGENKGKRMNCLALCYMCIYIEIMLLPLCALMLCC